MKPDLYICHTPYQVLVEICRAFSASAKPEILLSHTIPDAQPLAARLESCGLFSKVTTFDENACGSAMQQGFWRTLLLQHAMGVRNVEHYYGFKIKRSEYNNIYIHNDWSVLGRYLQDKNIPYILCEDTLGSTSHVSEHLICAQRAQPLFKLRRLFRYGYQYWGDWAGIKALEAEDLSRVYYPGSKDIEHSWAKTFHELTDEQKEMILNVFLTQPIPHNEKNSTLFLPRDFVADSLLNQEDQDAIYQAIVQKYCDGPLFIKAHPRDQNDYSILFPDAIILQRTMPSEVLNFCLPFRFSKAIAVESLVLNGLEVADEKLMISLKEAKALI